jgi:hypothetical protein
VFVDTKTLATAASISPQAARDALRRGHLQGHRLEVVEMPGRGGRGGRVYQVAVASLPPELQERVKALRGAVEPPLEGRSLVSAELEAPSDFTPRPGDAKARERMAALRPVLATEPGTRERSLAIANAAADGMSASQVRYWLKRYQRLGLVGLARKRRGDAGEAKAIAWRTLDATMREAGRSDQEIADLAERICRHVRGLLSATSASAAMIAHASIGFVAQELRAAGVIVAQDELIGVCRPSARFVRAERQARLVDVRRNDAGRYAAQIEPRIRRDRSHLLPLDVVAGDVAHLDILVRRPDGSTATPKIVAFLDLATNVLFYGVFLLAKGEGIRREHVLETFVAMCTALGVPTRVLVDHGSEFAALDLADDLFKLKGATGEGVGLDLVDSAEPGVQRSRPFNPQSKVAETIFSIINAGLLRVLPGYIGGNRMQKKTQNQGREPRPWPGTFAAFEAALATAIALYHDRPQSKRSHLAGESPNQRLRQHLDAGWQSVRLVDPEQLGAVFCTPHRRRVYAGGRFDFDRRSWRHDDLMPLAGGMVVVHEPLFGDRGRLFVFDDADRELLCEAEPEQAFAWGDPAGAGEQARQSAKLRRKIRELASQADPVDPLLAMAATVAEFGPAPVATTARTLDPTPAAAAPRRAKRSSLDVWLQPDRAKEAG